MQERPVAMEGAGCLVGIKGNVWVITPGDEVELEPGKAVVIPRGVGEVMVEAEEGAMFVRCVAPANAG
jgi:mannose-6-phosphate isomerase